MFRIFNKSVEAIKGTLPEGVIVFLKKLRDYFLSTNLSKKALSNFSSLEPEEVLSFCSRFCLGAIKPMQIKEEFLELLKIFKELNPRFILEIGTAYGGSLFCFCKLAREDAVIISVDLPYGKFGGGYPELRIPIYKAFAKPKQKLILLRTDSHKEETLAKVREILKGNFLDFLFIDGDHTYEGVRKDFEMYSNLVRYGGIIAFHDVVFPLRNPECRVHDFWKELCKRYPNRWREIIKDRNQGWGGIGILIHGK
ncbi:class I SAM-dependent methyltransferase [bacterium]|nr:class I SAM-dependent methyltransferase [bacterium]